MSKTVHLHTPLSEEEIRSLELDDVVYLSGEAYSMLYADHYTLILDWMEQGQEIPMNLNGGVIYNTGTIWRRTEDGRYDMRALGATTSSKFNQQTPPFIAATGIRAVIGKGGMDQATLDAMKQYTWRLWEDALLFIPPRPSWSMTIGQNLCPWITSASSLN